MCLVDFWNFLTIRDFCKKWPWNMQVKTSRVHSGIRTITGECDLINFWQFLHYLCFQGRGNPLLTFLLIYNVWGTLENLGRLPVQEVLEDYGLMTFVPWQKCSTLFMFSRLARKDCVIFLHELPCFDCPRKSCVDRLVHTWHLGVYRR